MEEQPNKKPFSFDKLDKLSSALYRREKVSPQSDNAQGGLSVNDSEEQAPSDWNTKDEHSFSTKRPFSISHETMKKIVLGASLFFLIAVGFGAYVFWGGINNVSTDNVAISVIGPSSIGAGEPLSFELEVKNQNNIDLEGVKLLVEYPSGTRTADDVQSELLRDGEPIGTITSGESIKRTKIAKLFDEADSSQKIIVSVEYRVKDSSATYFKEYNYDVLISTSPVRLTVTAVKEAVTGKDIEIAAEIVSNSATVVNGLMLRVDYPFGFAFTYGSPSPTYSNNIFLIGDLKPADRRVIRIRGTLTGQEGEERNFRINLGQPDRRDTRLLGTIFLTNAQSVTIKKPFVSAVLSLNGSSEDTLAIPAGQAVQGQISWTNNLPNRVIDLEIQAKIIGDSLNRFSVNANQGFFRSVDNVLVWDKTTSGSFAVIEPGESGVASFSLSSLPISSLLYSGVKGNEISIELSVKARRLSDANVPEEILSTASKKIRVSSNVAISGRSLYFTGPFRNQGPIPPKADRNTTYTVVWSVTNTINSVSNAQVQAVLPGYITWLGNVSPADESVSYDQNSHTVTWDVGDLGASTGFSSSPLQAAFQVAFIPSVNQIGEIPTLVGPLAITGIDRFTNAQLRGNARGISSAIEDGFSQPGNTSRVEE